MNSSEWELKFETICEEINQGNHRPKYHYTDVKFEREFQEWMLQKKDYPTIVDLIFTILENKFDKDIVLAYFIKKIEFNNDRPSIQFQECILKNKKYHPTLGRLIKKYPNMFDPDIVLAYNLLYK